MKMRGYRLLTLHLPFDIIPVPGDTATPFDPNNSGTTLRFKVLRRHYHFDMQNEISKVQIYCEDF